MSTPTHPSAPPGGGDRFAALLDAVGRMAEQQRAVLDALRPPPQSPSAAAPAPVAAPPAAGVSLDDVRAVVSDLLGRHHASAAKSAARSAYLRDHLADLPEAYRRLMPDSDDPAALADAEQGVRRQFRDDLKAARRTTGEPAGPAVGSGVAGGDSPAAAVDYSKLSPLGQIELGLRAAQPARAPAAPPAAREGDAAPDPHEQLFVGAD